ncbi:hypothetical protein ACKUUO_39765 [Streptomyces sp. MCC57]
MEGCDAAAAADEPPAEDEEAEEGEEGAEGADEDADAEDEALSLLLSQAVSAKPAAIATSANADVLRVFRTVIDLSSGRPAPGERAL